MSRRRPSLNCRSRPELTYGSQSKPPSSRFTHTRSHVRALGHDDPDRRRHPTRSGGRGDGLHMSISEYNSWVARASTTSDVFNAIAEADRREILDVLMTGEKAVGAIVNDLSMSQPQVSKHLRVLSEVGLVRCRAEGRRRLYRLEPARLRPMHDWLAKYEQAWNDRMDRLDNYLKELQQQGEQQ